jgi:hypothetical protein
MTKSERIGTLKFKYARRELTVKEKKELTAWRRAHPEEENLFKGSTDPENIMTDVGHFLACKEQGLQKLKDCYPDIWKDSPATPKDSLHRIIGLAALFMVGLSLILLFLTR